MELELSLLLILGGVALLAGFIDTLAGGGGLLTLPALLLAGLNPVNALATNKLQGTFGSGMATFMLLRRRRFAETLAGLRRPFLWSLGGSALGTVLVQLTDSDALQVLVPVVLAVIALYFLFSPGAGSVTRAPRLSARLYERTVVPVIGFYDGFFGPGTGSFFSLTGVALRPGQGAELRQQHRLADAVRGRRQGAVGHRRGDDRRPDGRRLAGFPRGAARRRPFDPAADRDRLPGHAASLSVRLSASRLIPAPRVIH